MPLHVTVWDIALRLLLTLCAGALLGLNRTKHGQPAGMRTTMLVCLSAALSMIEANLLLGMHGRAVDSFIGLDLMRLPLGVLSGIGFIGAGAIFRRGDLVRGVTTAATLWFVTMIGLCLGAGLLWLGIAGAVMGWVILSGVKLAEHRIPQSQSGTITLTFRAQGDYDPKLRRQVELAGHRVQKWSFVHSSTKERQTIRCVVRRRLLPGDTSVPDYVQELSRDPNVIAVRWDA